MNIKKPVDDTRSEDSIFSLPYQPVIVEAVITCEQRSANQRTAFNTGSLFF